jgi:hypothetical protein
MTIPDNNNSTPGAEGMAWATFELLLGLGEDLLPVVSDPSVPVSPGSSLSGVGKVPSVLNGRGEAVGLSGWTQKKATHEEIVKWSANPRLGMCLQTRKVRAFDIDIEDSELADAVSKKIADTVGALPCRTRANSSKRLFLFEVEGQIPKRAIRLDNGLIEMLGSGQQCIISGTHPSGARYEWLDGLPVDIPRLTLESLNAVWGELTTAFKGSTTGGKEGGDSRHDVLHNAISRDATAQYLLKHDWVKSTERDGRMHIRCPFEEDHTSESGDSATTYFPANTNGYATGSFKCLHGHCCDRTDSEFVEEIGISIADAFDVFHDEEGAVVAVGDTPHVSAASDFDEDGAPAGPAAEKAKPARFASISADDFEDAPPLAWKIKGVLPSAELAVVYGASGSGKSFFVFDMLASIARGEEWRGHKVAQGECVYLCAEGATGMRSRVKAYKQHREIKGRGQLPIRFITDAPNLTKEEDVIPLVREIRKHGKVSVVVVDTFAQAMVGENENTGEAVGKAIAHCRQISKHTGAMVVLIHHSGKDAASGARGWSGLRAACDMEMCISRDGDMRMAKVTKMKDGEEGEEFGFRLHPVVIGYDDDDEMVKSCVVEAAEIVRVSKEKAPVLEHRIVAAVVDEVGMTGREVDVNSVIEKVVDDMLPPAEGKKDSRRDKVTTALEGLIVKGLLALDKGKLSTPEGEDTS